MLRLLQQSFTVGLALVTTLAILPRAQAADSLSKVDVVYSVTRDLRRCAAPACGGWWVTPVNTNAQSLQPEVLLDVAQAPIAKVQALYAATLEFGCTPWTQEQINQFTALAESGSALISGRLINAQPISSSTQTTQYQALQVRDAFTAATKTAPSGSFFTLKSSGIVCITSPCPSYQTDLLNTNLSQELHDIVFAKEFSDEQQARARSAINATGLVVSAVQSNFKGQAGQGVRLDINQIFWPFPNTKAD